MVRRVPGWRRWIGGFIMLMQATWGFWILVGILGILGWLVGPMDAMGH